MVEGGANNFLFSDLCSVIQVSSYGAGIRMTCAHLLHCRLVGHSAQRAPTRFSSTWKRESNRSLPNLPLPVTQHSFSSTSVPSGRAHLTIVEAELHSVRTHRVQPMRMTSITSVSIGRSRFAWVPYTPPGQTPLLDCWLEFAIVEKFRW